MLLTEHNLYHYLLDKGMITAEPVLKGEFSVRRSDSRNNNFIVNKEFEHDTFFIKQVKAQEQEKIETMRIEATAYRLAANAENYRSLKNFLPGFYYYDSNQHVLILQQIKDALSVHDFYLQVNEFNNQLPALLADTLASYHQSINVTDSNILPGQQHFKKQIPWVFTITNNTVNTGIEAQTADQQIMQLIVKNAGFVQLLKNASTLWRTSTLTHNDAKFNNFLIGYNFEKKTIGSVKLIDWELADIGDPLWDVASVIQNYLTLWLSTDVPDQEQNHFIKRISLEQVQPCLQQFWQQYASNMKWLPVQAKTALLKATTFCALKLIHTCFETTPYTPTLQPATVRMLQMSLNILQSPEGAALKLLGIK